MNTKKAVVKVFFVAFFGVVCFGTVCGALKHFITPGMKVKILQRHFETSIGAVFLVASMMLAHPSEVQAAADLGGNDTSNTKIKGGGASTLQRGITKTITRGVVLDGSDFSNQNLRGVAFQQSIVRNCNFKGSDLRGASFFDATLDGSNFQGADLTLVNLELAQLARVNLKDSVCRELYIVGTTNFDGVATIENADFTDTELSKFQRTYLCNLESARGTNPTTSADTRGSLRCE